MANHLSSSIVADPLNPEHFEDLARSRLVVYLASPYSHEDPKIMELRYKKACRAAGLLMREGCVVFSPIAHSHGVVKYNKKLPTSWDFWCYQDLEMMKRCDALVVLQLNGWDRSQGVRAEMQFADRLKLPMYYMEKSYVEKKNSVEKQKAKSSHSSRPQESGLSDSNPKKVKAENKKA